MTESEIRAALNLRDPIRSPSGSHGIPPCPSCRGRAYSRDADLLLTICDGCGWKISDEWAAAVRGSS